MKQKMKLFVMLLCMVLLILIGKSPAYATDHHDYTHRALVIQKGTKIFASSISYDLSIVPQIF